MVSSLATDPLLLADDKTKFQKYQPTYTTNNLPLWVCTHFGMIGRISQI